jgi:hypothetical protein
MAAGAPDSQSCSLRNKDYLFLIDGEYFPEWSVREQIWISCVGEFSFNFPLCCLSDGLEICEKL